MRTDARLVPKLLEHLHAPFGTALDPFDTRYCPKTWKKRLEEETEISILTKIAS